MPDSPRTPHPLPAIVGAAVLLSSTALTIPAEGFASRPYWDPAHIRTYCIGETKNVQERTYSKQECEILLEQRMASDYAPAIERCAPAVRADRRVKIFAALLDAAYNAGAGAVCASPMVKQIRLGNLIAGCGDVFHHAGGFYGWRDTAHYRGPPHPAAAMLRAGWAWTGKEWVKRLGGLVTRRDSEARLCYQGAVA